MRVKKHPLMERPRDMTSDPKMFGYWTAVHDAPSASQAVRMAGLPVLIMGANAALLSLIGMVQQPPKVPIVIAFGLIGLLLIVIAFRIRSGHAGWVPLALILFAAFLGLRALGAWGLWSLAGQNRAMGVQIVFSWIIPIICLIFALSGLNGWRWLRANRQPLRF